MTVGIVDMPQEESDPLLNAIFDHSERPEFVYTHAWRVGRPAGLGQQMLDARAH
jgi:taurine dioxygenase